MNDTELDELLDTWRTPPPAAGLRNRLQAAATAQAAVSTAPKRKFFAGWRMLLASAAALVLIFLLVNPSAISQMMNPPPFTVESEIENPGDAIDCIDFGKIGLESIGCWPYSRPAHTLMSSYNDAGSEVVLSWSDPDNTLESLSWRAKLSAFSAFDKMHGILSPSEPHDDHAVVHFLTDKSWIIGEKDALLSAGCRPVTRDGEVVGAEDVLGYPTVIGRIHDTPKRRLTLWMAPRLSCFALRAKVEQQQPDGSWKLLSEKKALKVSLRR